MSTTFIEPSLASATTHRSLRLGQITELYNCKGDTVGSLPMAAGSTTYNFQITLSDLTRQVYETITVRIPRHSSELLESTLCKALAYCLEFTAGLELSKGLDDPEMPALWARDLTGSITHWIEVGAPSAEKLHKANKRVSRVCVYTYKNPESILEQLAGSKIHQAETIELISFTSGFLSKLSQFTDKRNVWSLTISDTTLYLEVANEHYSAEVKKRTLASV